MPDEKKAPEKPAPKMVPLADLLAVKNTFAQREKKWNEERGQLTATIRQRENEIKVLKASGENEIDEVRQALLDQDNDIKTKRTKYDEDLGAFNERQKALRARELALDLKSKGVEVETDALLTADDMEKEALSLHNEFLAKETERLKTQPAAGSPESVFESGSGSVLKKEVKDMTPEEFEAAWSSRMKEAAAK